MTRAADDASRTSAHTIEASGADAAGIDGARVRNSDRKDVILQAAATLFRQRGFHAVGMDDIGNAAGITGPAIYKHFAGKDALLVAVFDRVTANLLHGARAINRGHTDPREALVELIDFHISFALDDYATIAVYEQEERNLPPHDRSRIRRHMSLYMSEWVHKVVELRPDRSPASIRTSVLATAGLLNSVAHFKSGLEQPQLRLLLRQMALAAMISVEE